MALSRLCGLIVIPYACFNVPALMADMTIVTTAVAPTAVAATNMDRTEIWGNNNYLFSTNLHVVSPLGGSLQTILGNSCCGQSSVMINLGGVDSM